MLSHFFSRFFLLLVRGLCWTLPRGHTAGARWVKDLVQEVAEAWAGPLLLVAVELGRWRRFAVMAIMAAAALKANQLEVHAATAAVRKGTGRGTLCRASSLTYVSQNFIDHRLRGHA